MTPTRYHRGAREFDALRYDGSPARAAAIAAAFSGRVHRAGDQLEVSTGCGPVYAGAGLWIVRDCHSRTVSVETDHDFTARFVPIDPPGLPAVRLGGH